MRMRLSHRHESKRGIDLVADHREIQPVALGDRRPVPGAGAAERIHPQAQGGAANGLHVDHVAEIAHVRVQVIVTMRGGCT